MNIDGYTIEKQIGNGGMAIVYLAVQESLKRPVALKVMKPAYADSPEFSQRFLDEGRLLAAVYHPNILTIHDIGISNGNHFISMEYVEGGDLRDKLSQGISPEQATDYIATIADCLSVAHDAFIVHRDIKPANILFRADGTLLLGDFGIAKQLTAGRDLTVSGSLVGSPSYLSPEQALGKAVDGRSDIYSLGVLFYEMLSGEKPFTGDSDVDVAIKHIDEELPELPEELSAYWGVIQRMMQKAPEDRFPSCRSLQQALQELKETGHWSGIVADIPLPDIQDQTPIIEITLDAVEPTVVGMPPGMDPGASQSEPLLLKIVQVVNNRFMAATRVIADGSVRAYAFMKKRLARFRGISQGVHDTTTVERTAVHPSVVSAKPALLKYWKVGAVVTAGLAVIVVLVFWPGKQPDLEIGYTEELIEQAGSVAAAQSVSANKSKSISPSRHAKVTRLLQRADNALSRDHLTTPHKVSAYAYYQRVLELDQNNKAAKQGLDKIADRYLQLAKLVANDGEYPKAKQFVATGLWVRPKHQRLLQYRKELNSVENLVVQKSKEGLSGLLNWAEKKLFK